MAAMTDPVAGGLEIVDLKDLVGRELDPLLLEETLEWSRELDWDFGRSADLVHQFTDMRALMGRALLDRGEVVGYGYSVLEEQKGLIGDLYVRPPWRSVSNQAWLFQSLFDDLVRTPGVNRIESQLMLVDSPVGSIVSRERPIEIQERMLMNLDARASMSPTGSAARRFRIQPWAEHHHELAAGVISLAYGDHIDSQINDQYRSVAGARRFLYNVVQFPGCGSFFRHGSFSAFDPLTGWLAGIVLASFVGDEVGHVTQLCVTPGARGMGLGYELLRKSVEALRIHGARQVSLTVTVANTEATKLYERFGFQDVRHFLSYVWEPGSA